MVSILSLSIKPITGMAGFVDTKEELDGLLRGRRRVDSSRGMESREEWEWEGGHRCRAQSSCPLNITS
jgi:hypothetical protein